MTSNSREGLSVAVLYWQPEDGIGEMICHELAALNQYPEPFAYGTPIPQNAEILLSFGPYGDLLPIWRQAAQLPEGRRPVVVHWNTEGMPDLRIPVRLMRLLSAERSRIGRLANQVGQRSRHLQRVQHFLATRMLRFRNTGDYEYAFRKGWLHVLADSSAIYARLRGQVGLPTVYCPWGASALWYRDLKLERDVDVLWMGIRGSLRRGRRLDRIRQSLAGHGVRMHVADSIEHPFIYGQARIHFLNRAKITLNLTRTWYDDNFSRFAMAAPNRTLLVSEPMLDHCPDFVPGSHYVSAPVDGLVEAILYYLHHEDHRRQIVNNAFEMVTTKLAFRDGLRRIVDAARGRLVGRDQPTPPVSPVVHGASADA